MLFKLSQVSKQVVMDQLASNTTVMQNKEYYKKIGSGFLIMTTSEKPDGYTELDVNNLPEGLENLLEYRAKAKLKNEITTTTNPTSTAD